MELFKKQALKAQIPQMKIPKKLHDRLIQEN